mgnify:CR=1 FL=1
MATKFDKPVHVFKANPEKNAGVQVGEDWVSLVGDDPKNFLTVNKKGVGLGGKINLQSSPNDIKVGGLASFNMLPLLFTPSTTMSPISTLTLSLPFDSIIELADTVTSLMGLIK